MACSQDNGTKLMFEVNNVSPVLQYLGEVILLLTHLEARTEERSLKYFATRGTMIGACSQESILMKNKPDERVDGLSSYFF